jgi:hypothetical protein
MIHVYRRLCWETKLFLVESCFTSTYLNARKITMRYVCAIHILFNDDQTARRKINENKRPSEEKSEHTTDCLYTSDSSNKCSVMYGVVLFDGRWSNTRWSSHSSILIIMRAFKRLAYDSNVRWRLSWRKNNVFNPFSLNTRRCNGRSFGMPVNWRNWS